MKRRQGDTNTGMEMEIIKEENVKLKPRIKIYQAPAILLGLIIGSAIYVTPGTVLRGTGSPGLAILIWFAGGIFGTLGALSYAELGTTFPASGEKYYYLEKMYGPAVSFCYMWMYLFMYRPGANAIKCLVFGSYILKLVFVDCKIPDLAIKFIGVLLCLLITFINCISVEWSNRGHTFFLTLSAIALSVFSLLGLIYLGQGNTETWQDAFGSSSNDAGDIVLAFYSAVFAYGGWNALNFMLEEMEDPVRDLPRAIYITMPVITVLYMLVNIAYMSVLGVQGLLDSQAVAVSFGYKLFPPAAFLVPLVVCISQIPSFNSGFLVSSRLGFVAARRQHLPAIISLITTWSFSPVTSLILQAFLVILSILFIPISAIIKNLVFLQSVFDCMTIAGMLYYRKKRPAISRPIMMPLLIPIIFFILLLISVFIPLVTKPAEAVIGGAIGLGTGLPVYFVFVFSRWRPNILVKFMDRLTHGTQKLLLCVPQEGKYIW